MKEYKGKLIVESKKYYYQAESAEVMGDVRIAENVSIWPKTVIRTEEDPVIIGEETNIQDLCCVHVQTGMPVILGKRVTVGHCVILHGCQIDDGSMIGMGSIILNGAKIGKNCLIGAGSLVTERTVIPDGMLAFGRPAKVIRPLNEDEFNYLESAADHYVEHGQRMLVKKAVQE